MNKNQAICQICNPTPKTNKRIGLMIKRLFQIFFQNISNIEFQAIDDEKNNKQDFLVKIIEYFMLESSFKSFKINPSNCKKHLKFKLFLAKQLNLSMEHLEMLSQTVANKILQGKYQLSIVIHLSKNLAKSKCFEKSNLQNRIKSKGSTQGSQKNQKKPARAKQEFIKSETGSYQSPQTQKAIPQQRKGIQIEETLKINQKRNESIPDDLNYWNSYYEQYKLNQTMFSPYFYINYQ